LKVKIQEIEEYEITDPAGCCNLTVPKPKQFPDDEMEPQHPKPQTYPWDEDEMKPPPVVPVAPGIPGHLWWTKNIPGLTLYGDRETGDIKPAQFPTINTKSSPDPLLRDQWGIGTPMIQRARDNFRAAVDTEKDRKVEEDHGNSFTG